MVPLRGPREDHWRGDIALGCQVDLCQDVGRLDVRTYRCSSYVEANKLKTRHKGMGTVKSCMETPEICRTTA